MAKAKTYISTHKSFSAAFTDDGKKDTIQFRDGEFTTDCPKKQAHVEGLHGFGKYITVAPYAASPKEAAVAKAKAARAAAVKANAEAKAAEDAAAEFDKKAVAA